jgi:hypothetical protein
MPPQGSGNPSTRSLGGPFAFGAPMKIVFQLVAIIMIIPLALADDKQSWAMMGAGASTCGKFAEMYRENPAIAEALAFSWAQGFMSSMNVARSVVSVSYPTAVQLNLNSISLERQKSLIRAYCNEHPLDDYPSAVMKLYSLLEPIK